MYIHIYSIYIKDSVFSYCSLYKRSKRNYNFKFSVAPRFICNLLCCDLLIASNTFKADLLRNPWGMRSSIVDLTVKNFASHEVEQTN